MNFKVSHDYDSQADFVLIPLAKQSEFDRLGVFLSSKCGWEAERLRQLFNADFKEILPLPFTEAGQAKCVVLLGLGDKLHFRSALTAFRFFMHQYRKKLGGNMAIDLQYLPVEPLPLARWAEAAVNGLLLGLYDVGLYKTESNAAAAFDPDAFTVTCRLPQPEQGLLEAIERGRQVAEAQKRILDLVNAPANKKPPQRLADWALESGRQFGYQVKIFDKAELERMGMHALLAVGRGSEYPPLLISMEYDPGDPNLPLVALVGKGVTFDTGGLSIKPSNNMYYMKSDMGGAAAVLGTLEAAARLRLPVRLLGLVPATENSVDALSIRPGDVIESYSGKTIEVVDTDAEGRLILADALNYAVKQYQPRYLIDLATLTGSCVRTLGTQAGGLFSNDDELAHHLESCGLETGERLWRLPLWEEYMQEMQSDVADIKNLSGSPAAGAITAAKFLEFFIEKHPAWAHLDIAGVAFGDSEFSKQKSATGYGIRLLIEFLGRIAGE
ncbi:MAG: hypothetical protein KatS3mg029_0433 [Saprospiraceae bacterium]|nr:MAG: hypothetical protein KatS3mg029_0433 [Saprospiraceae bacterium]